MSATIPTRLVAPVHGIRDMGSCTGEFACVCARFIESWDDLIGVLDRAGENRADGTSSDVSSYRDEKTKTHTWADNVALVKAGWQDMAGPIMDAAREFASNPALRVLESAAWSNPGATAPCAPTTGE